LTVKLSRPQRTTVLRCTLELKALIVHKVVKTGTTLSIDGGLVVPTMHSTKRHRKSETADALDTDSCDSATGKHGEDNFM
jgi:hypothetical protein